MFIIYILSDYVLRYMYMFILFSNILCVCFTYTGYFTSLGRGREKHYAKSASSHVFQYATHHQGIPFTPSSPVYHPVPNNNVEIKQETVTDEDRCEVCFKPYDNAEHARTTFRYQLHDLELVLCMKCCASIESRQQEEHLDSRSDEMSTAEDETDSGSQDAGSLEQQERYEQFRQDYQGIGNVDGDADGTDEENEGALSIEADSESSQSEPFTRPYIADGSQYVEGHSNHLGQIQSVFMGVRPYECETCGKRFAQKSCLTRHTKIHTGERLHQCDECTKSFTRASNLRSHMRTHTGEKCFQCPICQKLFGQGSWLKRHIRTHTGEKEVKCPVCSKWVSSTTSLQSHMRTHTGEKPFACLICDKSFSVKCTLTVHMRIHTGSKPYVCEVCGAAFIQGTQLSTHMRVHTGEKPYMCEICHRQFGKKENLLVHVKVFNSF